MYERIVIVILLVLLVVAILLPRGSENAAASPDVLTVIHQRKSVRNYTAEPVAAKELVKAFSWEKIPRSPTGTVCV